jgi:hypothetical protein
MEDTTTTANAKASADADKEKASKGEGDGDQEESEDEEDAIEDAMEDIKECVGGIQPAARLAVLEALYAALFTTTSHHVSGDGDSSAAHAAAKFIAQEQVVAPVLALIALLLEAVPDSRRKLALVELVEEAQWRLDLIRAFSQSAHHEALPSVMARMSASPDGLAANCLRVNGTACVHACVPAQTQVRLLTWPSASSEQIYRAGRR